MLTGSPGIIERRQTTFWEVRASDGSRWRIGFPSLDDPNNVVEREFVEAKFDRANLRTEHPLLVDYRESWDSIFVSSRPGSADDVLSALDRLVNDWSSGWRVLSRYLNPEFDAEELLRGGFGKLMAAPFSLVDRALPILKSLGCDPSVMDAGRVRRVDAPPMHAVLFLGRNFILARDFKFERVA